MRHALALLLLGLCGAAQAHTRGASYSWWAIDAAGAQVRVRVSELELTRLQLHPAQTADYAEQAGAVLAASLQLRAGSQACTPSTPAAQRGSDGWLEARWSLRCPSMSDLSIRSELLATVAPGHLHFARVERADGPPLQRVLSVREPQLVLAQAPSAPASLLAFAGLGIEHILSGWDHIAFMLALLLLCGRLRDVVLIATGFTVAHSLTLALAVFGLVRTQAGQVEALIGFSIALAAIEGLWLRGGRGMALPVVLAGALVLLALAGVTRLPPLLLLGAALFAFCYLVLVQGSPAPARLRAAMGLVFGLVHGFGFASALAELELPRAELALGLLGFNAGVELGQLLVIALVWPVLQWSRRRPAAAWGAELAGSAICALGSYWFVVRSFGT